MKLDKNKYNLRYIGEIENPLPDIYGSYFSRSLYPNTNIQSDIKKKIWKFHEVTKYVYLLIWIIYL
jgi:hypothetical protein